MAMVEKFSTFGLNLSSFLFAPSEQLSKTLQSKDMPAKVASDAINLNEKFYGQIIRDAAGIENIEEPRFPRFRQPPKKSTSF